MSGSPETGRPTVTSGGAERSQDAGQSSQHANSTTNAAGCQGPSPLAGLAALDVAELAREAMIPRNGDRAPQDDTWQILSLADAYLPRPASQYLVAGLLPLPSLTILYGPPGCLKTFLGGDIAVCVAGGLPWLPSQAGQPTARTTMQAPALWIDCDNGRRRTDERFEALGRFRNLRPDSPLYYVVLPRPPFDAGDAAQIDLLIGRVRRLGAKFLGLDNLGTISGGRDENSSQMIEVMSGLRYLTECTGAAVLVNHHQRKGFGHGGRAGDTLRGHSSIEAAIDLALQVTRDEHSDLVTIKSTKTRDVDVADFGAYFDYTWKPESQELATATFWGQVVADTSSDRAIENAILDVLHGGPDGITQTALKKVVRESLPDVGSNRIAAFADRMAASGILAVRKGKDNAKLYSVVERTGFTVSHSSR
jgi:hypothetical protein